MPNNKSNATANVMCIIRVQGRRRLYRGGEAATWEVLYGKPQRDGQEAEVLADAIRYLQNNQAQAAEDGYDLIQVILDDRRSANARPLCVLEVELNSDRQFVLSGHSSDPE